MRVPVATAHGIRRLARVSGGVPAPYLLARSRHAAAALHHSITPSLHHSITPSLHHSITPSLHHSITPSPHPRLTPGSPPKPRRARPRRRSTHTSSPSRRAASSTA